MKKFFLRLFKGTILHLIDELVEEGLTLLDNELSQSMSLNEAERMQLKTGAVLLARKVKTEAADRLS